MKKNLAKKKKKMSLFERRLITGGLIFFIVACWLVIGAQITVSIKGPNKARAMTSIAGCTFPNGNTGCASGVCNSGDCTPVVLGGVSTCGCVTSATGPTPSGDLKDFSVTAGLAGCTFPNGNTGCASGVCNSGDCTPVVLGGVSTCGCVTSATGPTDVTSPSQTGTAIPTGGVSKPSVTAGSDPVFNCKEGPDGMCTNEGDSCGSGSFCMSYYDEKGSLTCVCSSPDYNPNPGPVIY
jgi:hypothetical protein